MLTLTREVDAGYAVSKPAPQHGAIPGGGADLAHRFALASIEFAAAQALSIVVLFVDLAAAFERALREFAFGFPQDVLGGDRFDYLVRRGLCEGAARWVPSYVAQRGAAFASWGAGPKVEALVRGLRATV